MLKEAKHKIAIIFLGVGVLAALLIVAGGVVRPGSEYDVEGSMKVEIIERGEGRAVADGEMVVIDYVGFRKDGTEFDRQNNYTFTLGSGNVLQAWSLGMKDMKIGEKRRLTLEPHFAFGEPVVFEIKLVDIK